MFLRFVIGDYGRWERLGEGVNRLVSGRFLLTSDDSGSYCPQSFQGYAIRKGFEGDSYRVLGFIMGEKELFSFF